MKCEKCVICGDGFVKSSHKKRPVCNKTTCQNKWTYRLRLGYYLEKHRAKYWVLKKEKHEYLRAINQKAKTRQRFGVDNRNEFIQSRGGLCQNCGSDRFLRIHHIDNNGRKAEMVGKKPNNSPQNLVVLCQGCHVSHHRHGMKLKLKT